MIRWKTHRKQILEISLIFIGLLLLVISMLFHVQRLAFSGMIVAGHGIMFGGFYAIRSKLLPCRVCGRTFTGVVAIWLGIDKLLIANILMIGGFLLSKGIVPADWQVLRAYWGIAASFGILILLLPIFGFLHNRYKELHSAKLSTTNP